MDDKMTTTTLNLVEVNAILAGLRTLQYWLIEVDGSLPSEIDEIFAPGGTDGLTIEQIDDLCERLNCGTVMIGDETA